MIKHSDKERILKEPREKKTVTYKGSPIRFSVDFLSRNFASQKRVAWYIQSAERRKKKNPIAKDNLSSKATIQNKRRDRVLQTTKVKGKKSPLNQTHKKC